MYYPYAASYAMEEGILALLSGLFSGIPSFVIGIATYIFTALSLQTIAKRRCISKTWLCWIPVANLWVLGSLSDQYRYVVRGEDKSKRKVLLILGIITAVLTLALLGSAIWLVVQLVVGAASRSYDAMVSGMAAPLLSTAFLSLPLLGVAIALAIVKYMALYDVYTSCDPQNNVLFLVFSILLPVTEPIFLFISRQKDLGMPPRLGAPVYAQPQQPQWQQPQQPWSGGNYNNP